MISIHHQPAQRQAQTRSALNGPLYYQIRLDRVKRLLKLLKSFGYISHDPKLAGIVTRILLGEDSAEFQALITAQGKDFEFWTMFACSPEQVERWKRGYSVSQQVHLACCKAVEKITGAPFPIEEVSAIDPVPHFPAIKAAVDHLIEATRISLLNGQTVNHLG
ncbi:hypothetical protein QGP82_21395 [Leptothoe sp. LEGE 181152]|nr:hypothetical protein [Leptothoe sp. LEGE 181152]